MTRCGIVTFTHGNNYGCFLQRYALQNVLSKLSVESLFLLFTPPFPDTRSDDCGSFLSFLVNRKISVFAKYKKIATKCGKIPHKVLWILLDVFVRLFVNRNDRRAVLFADFGRQLLRNTLPLSNYQEVCNQDSCFDFFVAGSDQIWNPNNRPSPADLFFRYFMLDFVQAGKKLSYAASLGVPRIDDQYIPFFKKYLTTFSYISVRENEGAKELARILNRPIDVVLDPTMLLTSEEWDDVANKFPTRKLQSVPYILCYSLGNRENVVSKALQIRKSHKLPILYICTSAHEYALIKLKHSSVKPLLNTGPGEFVSLFKNSAYVVTDSFHGSVFSILYRKPFFTMLRDREDPTKSMNSRMSTLFSTFHLESRLFSPEDKSPLTPESFEINYEAVDKILRERREFSINKLREAIENVVKQNADA